MGIRALLGIYDEYVSKGILQFIPTYKLSQDHIELFLEQLDHKGEGGAGNCIPLEEINILNFHSKTKPPEQILNETIPNRLDVDMESDNIINDFLEEHNYAIQHNSLSPYSLQVITYIAGFVAFRLGGLSYPSDDVISICIQSEKYFKEQHNIGQKIDKEFICSKVLKYFLRTIIIEEYKEKKTNVAKSKFFSGVIEAFI
ncbi:hypothetical protein ABEB36_012860 [Hypothenemus hampei]|uniref:Uncharacterized protein n=1 Tax=Hypothenemus hampei TaxID=57062 RepID=A0ABD1E610_HYPHA